MAGLGIMLFSRAIRLDVFSLTALIEDVGFCEDMWAGEALIFCNSSVRGKIPREVNQ